MSDAVLKNARVNLEALRRRGQHVDAAQIARVAGLAGHSLTNDGETTTGASAQKANRGNANVRPTGEEEEQERSEKGRADNEHRLRGGEIQQTDHRTVSTRHMAGYDFNVPAGTVEEPRVLPAPGNIAPGQTPPSGANSRGAAPVGLDAIINYSGAGGSGRSGR